MLSISLICNVLHESFGSTTLVLLVLLLSFELVSVDLYVISIKLIVGRNAAPIIFSVKLEKDLRQWLEQ